MQANAFRKHAPVLALIAGWLLAAGAQAQMVLLVMHPKPARPYRLQAARHIRGT